MYKSFSRYFCYDDEPAGGGGSDDKGGKGQDDKGAGGDTPGVTKEDVAKMSAVEAQEFAMKMVEKKQEANAAARADRLKLETYEAADEKAKTDKLEKDGKLVEALELERKGREADKVKYQVAQKKNAITIELTRQGSIDPDFASLVDTGGIGFDDSTGEITGVEKAVTALKKAKPHLFGSGDDKKVPGKTPGQPGGGGDEDEKKSRFKDRHKASRQIQEHAKANQG